MSDSDKSVLGLSTQGASVLAYAGWFISGILILIFEKDNKIVRFHAMQSTILFLALFIVTGILSGLFGWIWFVGFLVETAISLFRIAVWAFLIYRAYTAYAEPFKIPIIGDAAWRQVNK